MKTLIYFFAFVMFFFAGCVKDEIFNDVQDTSELKKAKVPIPMKGEVCMISNDEDRLPVEGPIPGIYLSRTALLTGNMTHMGKLEKQSWMIGTSAYLDLDALSIGKIVIVAVYEAEIYGANGDFSELISYIRIDATDPENRTITGEYTINGGSGKWENTTGTGTLSGILPCWDVEGMVEFN